MVNVTGILKNKIALPVLNSAVGMLTPLDTFNSVRQHTMEYPLLRNYLWKIELPQLSSPSNNESSGILDSIKNAATEVISNAIKTTIGGNNVLPTGFVPKVVSASVPFPSLGTNSVTYQGWSYAFPTNEKLNALVCNVWADENGFALAYYFSWYNSIRNRDGTFNYPINYERDVPIGLYRTDGSLAIQLIAKGVFPTELSQIDLSDGSNGSAFKAFRITFNVNEIGITKINGARDFLGVVGKATGITSNISNRIL